LIDEEQFSEEGLLSNYFKKAKNEAHVDMKALFRYILLISEITHLIKCIEQ